MVVLIDCVSFPPEIPLVLTIESISDGTTFIWVSDDNAVQYNDPVELALSVYMQSGGAAGTAHPITSQDVPTRTMVIDDTSLLSAGDTFTVN